MAIKEQDKVFYEELANGDKVINLPITRANNVEGLGRSANTAYVVGDVVYVDNNKKVALKCTQAGTTSNSELIVSTASIGDVITDGTVKWQVCNRTSDVTSVNGKTGDVEVGEVTDLSISGKTVTVTFADNTTKTLTTQDTAPYSGSATSIGGASATKPAVVVDSYKDGYNWYRVYSDGWIEQGGRVSALTATPMVTLLKEMADEKYHINITVHTYTTNSAYDTILYGGTYGESVNTTSFKLMSANYGNHEQAMYRTWEVKGQGA